jgi:transcription initiation factor IIE alpha subunit
VEIDENPFLLAVCPSCGKPMKMQKSSEEQEEDKSSMRNSAQAQ